MAGMTLRGVYLLLVLVRLYFATLPSYIHPDEHFQGPEIITGEIFGWPVYKTWEFTSATPIRSIFPLWLVYGPSLTIWKWISEGIGHEVQPIELFYVLRTLMFLLSFVLEDWALYELLPARRERTVGLLLVASSYVTASYQMHTVSNSIETLLVLWCLVLMARLRDNEQHTQARLCIALGFLGVLGVFNRITFPAFLLVAGAQTLPHLIIKPMRGPVILLASGLTALVAVAMDTEYYTGRRLHFRDIFSTATITPWNNLAYNIDSTNLAEHGLHPFWQHFVANLPQLIGPAFPLLAFSSRKDTLFWSGIVGIAVLSCFSHQEARFLIPAVPLLLASIKLPQRLTRLWIGLWLIFNLLAVCLFGMYHQGGIIAVQNLIAHQPDVSQATWWKTYSPPRWLLGVNNTRIDTVDLMGMSGDRMIQKLTASAHCEGSTENKTLLVAPWSATYLDPYMNGTLDLPLTFTTLRGNSQHIGLDDLDFTDDGVWPTLKRVVGRRGLIVREVSKPC